MDTQQNRKNEWLSLVRNFIMMAALLLAALPTRAQQNYVFYNATYGYLYNDNGTLKSSATLQYDKSSVWIASGAIGSTSRTIQSYTDRQYLGYDGYLSGTTANWRGYNNYLAYRSGYTNYYLKATSATDFTTSSNSNNGQRYYYYTVTLTDYPAQLADFSINSGVDVITATGNYSYGHTNTTYRQAYVNYYFNSANHYVLSDNTQNGTTAPATTAVNTGYTWSLSNADGYATVNSATGEITVSTLPDVDMEMVLTCSVSSHGLTKTATKNIELRGTHPIEPTITRSGNDITIATPSNGATIYYTLDGTEPTTSSNVYTAPFNVFGETYPLTIKAVAIRTGNASSVASTTYTDPGSGVGGGAVILNDYEPHSWSYYGDSDCPIHSLNPADVKITYYGDGIVMSNNNDYTAGTSNYVSPGDANYVGGAKVNVGGEDENTFVYYKTLERTDGSTSANPTGRCLYTTIPNPFQVRPTYGSRGTTDQNTFTGWRGFQCWRLKSVTGGSVYSAATGGTALATGAIINGETDIYFAPSNEYGMEVELEAVWARAYVVKGDQGTANNILAQNVGVERNFMILTAGQNYRFDGTSGRYITNKGYAVTISNYYPNGETGSTASTVSGYNDMTLEADTKFENVTFNSMGSYTLTAANHSLTIGRGCSGTIDYVSGINGNVTSPNYTIRLESGTINYLSFLKGYSTTGGTATDASGTLGGTPNVKGVLGCDYDRATNSGITNNLIVNNGAYYGYSVSENGTVYSEKSFVVHVKSGKIGNSFTINNSYTADAAQAFYIGVAGQRVRGHRILYMEGGEVASIAGGIDATANQNNNSVTVRMTGGHVRGAVYGGAARSAAYGNRNLIVTGGSITGWIGGGCNGEAYPAGQTNEDTYGGITNGATKVYFGGTATCGGTGSNVNINGSQGGIVFGAGKGVEGNTTSGRMAQGTTVVVADECNIERNVYGGGNFGYAQTLTTVYVSGGTVQGSVFGGSNQNNGPVINITMAGGLIEGGLYGGSNTSGTISNDVTMQVNGGTVGDGTDGDGIFGGGYGASTIVNGNVSVTLGASTTATDSATVNGNVYGGSALGRTNNGSATNTTTVTMNKALVNGNLFGGAYGNGANVNGRITVNVNGGRVNGNVFGGGDAAAYSKAGQNYPVVNMTGGKVTNVFGGGKGSTAVVTGNPQVILSGTAHVTGNVYGGGDAAEVSGHTNVELRD